MVFIEQPEIPKQNKKMIESTNGNPAKETIQPIPKNPITTSKNTINQGLDLTEQIKQAVSPLKSELNIENFNKKNNERTEIELEKELNSGLFSLPCPLLVKAAGLVARIIENIKQNPCDQKFRSLKYDSIRP
eukprot:UN01470